MSTQKHNHKIFMTCYKLHHKQIVIKLKKHLENYLSNIILIEMLVIKIYKKSLCKLNELIKHLLMCRKEIPMICLVKKVWKKSKKDQNLKVVIFVHKCQFLCQHFTLVAQVCIVLDADKYVNIVKELVMFQGFYINVMHVEEVVRWLEKLRLKIKLNK